MTATCHNPTCENWNIPITVPDDAATVICGPCGTPTELKDPDA